ncbi:hypothetical protein Droror1_Dr00001391 [Drosera rotundifolia]
MDSRALAALLCPLVSQLILLLSPLLPFSSPPLHLPLLPLLHLFLSSDVIAATTVLSDPRKRRRLGTEDENNPDNNNSVKYRVLEQSETLDKDNEQDNLDENNGPDNPLEYRGREHSGELPFIPINPDSFPLHFRMSSSTFHYLVGLLEPLLDCRDPVHSPLNLSPELRLAIGLFRLATGSDYSETGAHFRVSEPVARFCTKQLCRVLCTNFRFWVGFPDQDELVKASKGFEKRTGLPNCCGLIGCTRFRIRGNSIRSVAVQMVVDSECRILSIVAGFDGKKDDWSILKSSSLYEDINDGKLLENSNRRVELDGVDVTIPQYLVGVGRKYPLLPWLQIPFPDSTSPGSREEDFNAGCEAMRGLMRRTVASLKNWGVLSKPIEGECRNAVAYIGACAILHNALLLREDFSALSDATGVEVDDDDRSVRDLHGSRPSREGEGSEQGRQGLEIRKALAAKAKHFRMVRESDQS